MAYHKELPVEETDELRADIKRFLKSRPDVRYADLAQHTSLSESTTRNFLSGNCPGGRQVAHELRKALTLALAGDILPPGRRPALAVAAGGKNGNARPVAPCQQNFYETETVKRIAEVCDYCAERAEIGICTAGFGVGKTEAVRAWRRSNGGHADSIIFEFCDFSSSNKIEFVSSLARQLGLQPRPGMPHGGENFRAICDYLREHPLLIAFDQCETVRARIFQIIRQLHDRTHEAGVGVVILAAPILLARLSKSGMDDLGALQSRVSVWAALSGTTKAEMAAILKAEGVTNITDDAFALWWHATGGSMRRLMKSLDLIKAKHSGKRVTEKTIAGVAGHLWGMTPQAGGTG